MTPHPCVGCTCPPSKCAGEDECPIAIELSAREASSTPHPDTLRLEKLAKDLNRWVQKYREYGDSRLSRRFSDICGMTADDLRAYIDGLED